MSKPVIEVKNVSIKYITGDLRNIGLKEFVMKKLTGKYEVQSFMAVDNVSFTVEQGDMLGIIGTNGAGKSTLLKAVTKIMVPTKGSVTVNGKIAALLELASGFDGDLNLKENAYLRGAMLGYTRKFMDEKYPEILEFSGLREFEQRPFKQLSSGMKSRIAFSIASMVEPEILILDEVLSVGDGAFREKSEAKMQEIIKNGKATILVSHSIPQIRRMCNKVLWLDHGKQIAFGETEPICDSYEEFLKTGKLPEIK
jgi:ABC-2 type transport system ATP-binding protein